MRHVFYCTKSYGYMNETIAARGFARGALERGNFPDGERSLKIDPAEVRGADVLLCGGTIGDSEIIELYSLAVACVKYGANRLCLMIPYYGYATMERAVKGGEVVMAKTMAMLLSAIPQAPMGNCVLLLDLHSEGIPHYFENNTTARHVYAKKVVCAMIERAARGRPYVLGSTDAGRAKWVESLAHDLHVMPAFCYKQRLSGTQTRITGVNANVKDTFVVIYDDMIRTGGSVVEAARTYKEAGASGVAIVTTHGLFVGECRKKFEACGIIESVSCTNSHPNSLSAAFYGIDLHVVPIEATMLEAIAE
jgi:ribose-phosphate pyrophosphokinase